jgi:DNA-binding LytR/AlgR family response regulator
MNCIIADDEPLARKGLTNFVNEVPFLRLIAMCSNAFQVIDELKNNSCDLLFLDIQMPKMTGIEFLKNVHNAPATIITTAYPDYALVSYELDVIDYLVKPIPFERFVKAVSKAKEYSYLKSLSVQEKSNADFFFIKCENRYEKIFFKEIIFVQALQNYVIIQTESKRFISYLTFKGVEEYLPKENFLKVNKSYLVSLAKVESITSHEIKIGSHSFKIGDSHKDEVKDRLLKDNKLLKRK